MNASQSQKKMITLPKQRRDTKKRVKSSSPLSSLKKSLTRSTISDKIDKERITIQKKLNNFLIEDGNKFLIKIEKGNNSKIVRDVLMRRKWLIECPQGNHFNFMWKPTSKDFNFVESKDVYFNHLQTHRELTTKSRLYSNLKSYCTKKGIDYNQFLPKTIILSLDSNNIQSQIKEFLDQFVKKTQNFWLLKPPDMNRGQGIKIFNQVETFFDQISLCFNHSKQVSLQSTLKNMYFTLDSGKQYSLQVLQQKKTSKSRQVVLQKYIETPLLFAGRKFDFRVWVLVDTKLNYYMFKEGYLRLCSEQYSLQEVDNLYVHLTNNAIQKNHKKYQKYELGNQLSYADLQSYFEQKGHDLDVEVNIIQKMKKLIILTMQSVQDKFQVNQGCNTFEIFGYDFMIDNQANIWLIEINTNPCLETSSPLLEILIPRMLNDAFKLTVDLKCNPDSQESKPAQWRYNFANEFNVPGYEDDDNLWEYLGKI